MFKRKVHPLRIPISILFISGIIFSHKSKKIVVVEKDEELKQYPKAKILCPKCGHKEAYWYLQQTRGGDEPQTKFLCCTKCGYKWREY